MLTSTAPTLPTPALSGLATDTPALPAASLDRIADAWAMAMLEEATRPLAFRFSVQRATYDHAAEDAIGGKVRNKRGDLFAGFVVDVMDTDGQVHEQEADFLHVAPAVAGKDAATLAEAVRARRDSLRRRAATLLNDAAMHDALAVSLDEGRVPVEWPGPDLFATHAA